MKLEIWHNNACSTSRKTLDFLREKGYELAIRNYLTQPPTNEELISVLKKMNTSSHSILRKKDMVFQNKFSNKSLSENEWIKAMSDNPSIIERPIVIAENKAWLARPFNEWVEKFNP